MLYPVKSKERKLEKDEFELMMSRLYVVQKKHKADYKHVFLFNYFFINYFYIFLISINKLNSKTIKDIEKS